MLNDDLDLNGLDPAAVDAVTESGGLIPDGKYHVRLDGAKEHTAQSGSLAHELVFTILAGPFAGQEINEKLWVSNKDAAKNRVIRFAHRLGIYRINSKTQKYERVPGKSDFADCFGAEAIVEVKQETYKRNDGKDGKSSRITFGGIWALDEKQGKDAARAKPGTPPAEKRKPAVDTSTL